MANDIVMNWILGDMLTTCSKQRVFESLNGSNFVASDELLMISGYLPPGNAHKFTNKEISIP